MFIYDENKRYGLAPLFGGYEVNPETVISAGDTTQLAYTFTTDENRLNNYLFPCYTLRKPEVTIGYSQFRNCDFLAGSGYNAAIVSIPVYFHGTKDHLEGDLNLVVWENKTIPIIGGREESGIPKIPADIEDLNEYKGQYFTNLSYKGNTFLQMKMFEPQPVTGPKLEQLQKNALSLNQLGWRYIPKIGGPGADLSQLTLYPQSFQIRSAWTGAGSLQWTKLSVEQNEREYYIINALAGLPVKSMGPVFMCKGSFVYKPDAGRVLM
jgi:acetoacetate decarboxylase